MISKCSRPTTVVRAAKPSISGCTLPDQCQYLMLMPLHPSHPRSNASTTSSGNGPFSRSMRFCSICFVLEAPMIMASPFSRLSWLWWVIHRSAHSASVNPCFLATGRRRSSALKYASFQYRMRYILPCHLLGSKRDPASIELS